MGDLSSPARTASGRHGHQQRIVAPLAGLRARPRTVRSKAPRAVRGEAAMRRSLCDGLGPWPLAVSACAATQPNKAGLMWRDFRVAGDFQPA